MSLAAALEASFPPASPVEAAFVQFVAGFLWFPSMLAMESLASLRRVGDWLSHVTTAQLRRLLFGNDTTLWIEFLSATMLIVLSIWFLTEPRLAGPGSSFRRLMPLQIWVAWTVIIGLSQGFSATSQSWRVRAQGAMFAGLYWFMTFLSLLFRGALSALVPVSLVMAIFCGLVVIRYYWGSSDENANRTKTP